MIADLVGIDKMTVHAIITKDLQITKIFATLVLKVLADDQRQKASNGIAELPQLPLQSRSGSGRLFPVSQVKTAFQEHCHGTD